MVTSSAWQPERKVMNNPTRIKAKVLILLTFCVFMTLSMLAYVMKVTDKCGGELCLRVSHKSPLYKSEYFSYNWTQLVSRSSLGVTLGALNGSSTAGDVHVRRTGREILKVLNAYNLSEPVGTRTAPMGYSLGLTSSRSVMVRSSFVVSGGDVYTRRQKNLQHFCHKYFKVDDIRKMRKMKLNHILIDERHKVLYCYVPKVACTNWKRIFLVLTGKVRDISDVVNLPSSEVHAKNLFKSLQNYTIPEVHKMAEEYTKFIFVRHPFERLLSAYRNKLEQHYDSSKYFQARFGKYIIKNFRKNPSNVSLERGDDVTFAEFVRYLLSRDPSSYNEHWQRVTDLCHPCLLNYDFIGKYETLLEDSNYLLRRLGLNVSFPILAKPSTTATNLKKYYNTLGKSAIYKLYSIYQMDFRLFGYDLFNVSDWSNNS